jgi:L-aspartate oxidase
VNAPRLRSLPRSDVKWTREADVVIVGTGAAGLSAALTASAWGQRVIVLCKGGPGGGSTPLAQGGLAAVMDRDDTFELHVADTLVAGAGIAQESAVNALVRAAPGAIGALAQLGARFDEGELGLEGGHSHRRIVHAGGDASGAEVHRTLLRAVLDANIEILEETVAIDAVLGDDGRVLGLLAGRVGPAPLKLLDVGMIRAATLVLASGGFGQAYATTSNPVEVTGDGLALAARAGAKLTDVEFVQFHPTVLFQSGRRGQCPLVTEALRGAGGVIIDAHGKSVMAGQHPLADLAPRDVVAATMQRAMASGDGPSTNLWLDVRPLGAARLEHDFPTVTSICRSLGIDPASEPIPVAPGAHYACGGVAADMDGRTTVPGLYAIGEVASTGVHGANRLASNSLTEALITGRRMGQLFESAQSPDPGQTGSARSQAVSVGTGVDPGERDALAAEMSLNAGVLRNREGLEHLLGRLEGAAGAASGALDLETLEATNLHCVSSFVANAAWLRTESRGCHRRSDCPETSPQWAQRIEQRVVDGEVVARVGALV